MKKFSIIILVFALLMAAACGKGERSDTKIKLEDVADFVLEVEDGRDVKILQLTDIQIIDSAQRRYDSRLGKWAIENWATDKIEERAWRFTREAVEKAQPDLIVLSGDNVYGEFDDAGTSLQSLVAEIDGYGIPWTFTFGNHDNETVKGIEWTCEQYMNADHCIFTRGDINNVDGNGNFNIAVTQGGKLTEIIWLMDSNGKTSGDREQNLFHEEGLRVNQITWFTERSEKLKEYNGGVSPKNIGFFHHPMRAAGEAAVPYGYNSAKHEIGENKSFKTVIIPENDEGAFGAMHVDPNTYVDNEFYFHNLLKTYACEGWFFGHEHQNNASAFYEGVRYTYGLKASQYDAYVKGEVGGTLITVGEGKMKVRHLYTDLPD